jgi:hypothetical protein
MIERVFEDEIPADKIKINFGLVRSEADNPLGYVISGTSYHALLIPPFHFGQRSLMLDTTTQGCGKWLISYLNGT